MVLAMRFSTSALLVLGLTTAAAAQPPAPCPPLRSAPSSLVWRMFPGNALRLTWTTDGAGVFDVAFKVEVGTAPGLADVASQAGTPRYSVDLVLPAGLALVYARVMSDHGACGKGPASEEVTIVTNQTAPSTGIVINEFFYDFVELKNISSRDIEISGWEVFVSPTVSDLTPSLDRPDEYFVVLHSGAVRDRTILRPGCTYLMGRASGSDEALTFPFPERGVAIVKPDGMVVDGVGRLVRNIRVGGSQVSPFSETIPLPRIEPYVGLYAYPYARWGDRDTNNNFADFIETRTTTPVGSSACAAAPPAPLELHADVNGQTVALRWEVSPDSFALSHLLLEVGLTPGSSTFGPFPLDANTTGVTFTGVPDGTYYARLRAVNANGVSPPSTEVAIVVCWQNCSLPPGAATNLTFQLSGRAVLLAWRRPTEGGTPTTYVIEAGSVSGAANLGQFPTGGTTEFILVNDVPPGVYYVRVRALNSGGLSPPSNEVVVVVQ